MTMEDVRSEVERVTSLGAHGALTVCLALGYVAVGAAVLAGRSLLEFGGEISE